MPQERHWSVPLPSRNHDTGNLFGVVAGVRVRNCGAIAHEDPGGDNSRVAMRGIIKAGQTGTLRFYLANGYSSTRETQAL